jgi:hypothetical protein
VCCAVVRHKPKEGSPWWKICGGAGAHTHQGLMFCGRHQMYPRTQAARDCLSMPLNIKLSFAHSNVAAAAVEGA